MWLVTLRIEMGLGNLRHQEYNGGEEQMGVNEGNVEDQRGTSKTKTTSKLPTFELVTY